MGYVSDLMPHESGTNQIVWALQKLELSHRKLEP